MSSQIYYFIYSLRQHRLSSCYCQLVSNLAYDVIYSCTIKKFTRSGGYIYYTRTRIHMHTYTNNYNKICIETHNYNKMWQVLMEEPRMHICLWQPEKLHKRDDPLNEEKEFGKCTKIGETFQRRSRTDTEQHLKQQNRKHLVVCGRI